jgi:hypothetical protein
VQVLKGVHVFALVVLLNSVIPLQFAHARSVVLVAFLATRVPAEQVRVVVHARGEVAEPAYDWYSELVQLTCAVQVVCPDSPWYSLLPSHADLLALYLESAHMCPGGHSMQLVALARYEPAPHFLQ